MADKDTPEDAEARVEPVPLPDGPRSEGGPAQRAPDPAPAPASPAIPAAASEPPAFDPPALPETEPEPPERAPEPSEPPHASDPDAGVDAPWHAAIADALAEPTKDAPPELHEPPAAEDPVPDAPERDPMPEPGRPPLDATQPITDAQHPPPCDEVAPPEAPVAEHEIPHEPKPEPEPEPCDPPPEPDPASFTAAVDELFHPPTCGPGEEPHLITLGRRLDPARVIPRPEPPVIAPREEQATAPDTPWKAHLLTAARYAAYAAAGYLALVLVLIVVFRFVNPPGSMLMLTKLLGGTAIDRTWVPLASISPALIRAVIVSEDARFCAHGGIDTAAMRQAIEQAARGTPRGASTISMQVTKNLFLWSAKSYVRKVIEIPLTLVMELIWPKKRIVEVYLNIAEWGPGVFGAEAAARHHFKKSAAKLSEREAALLAAALPNPMVRVAGSPGPRTSAKARVIQSRVKAFGSVASCVAAPPPAPAASPPAVRRTPLKSPAKPAPRKKTAPDDWTPTLRFGP